MRRVSVLGAAGSGKTTFGRALAARLGVPFVELDALHHLPGWTERAAEEFRGAVADAMAGGAWVVDGSYHEKLGGLVLDQADTVVWLDYERWFVTQRVVRRTLRRVVTRQELWNGNREPLSNLWSRDPLKNIVVWSWTTHPGKRERYAARIDDRWVRLRTQREAAAWLRSVSPAGAST